MKVKKSKRLKSVVHKANVIMALALTLLVGQVQPISVDEMNEIGDIVAISRQDVLSMYETRALVASSRSVGLEERDVLVPEETQEDVSGIGRDSIVEEPIVDSVEEETESTTEAVPDPEPIVEEEEPSTEVVEEPEIVPIEPPVMEEVIEIDDGFVRELIANTGDVRQPSNATPEELNNAINSMCKWMREYDPNLGEYYAQMEQQYGINAYFAIAVSMQEVGRGEPSARARNKNNIYGLMTSTHYASYEDCIDYWYRLISKSYVGNGRISVQSISQKYCGGDPTWINNVSNFMYQLKSNSTI